MTDKLPNQKKGIILRSKATKNPNESGAASHD